MDLYQVKVETAAAVGSAISGLTCVPYAVDAVTPPMFMPVEIEIDPNQTFGGSDLVVITWRVLVSRADPKSAQKALDGYLARTGATSIRAALVAARGDPGESALNGAADDLVVTQVSGYQAYDVGSAKYLGADITVKVIGSEGA